MLELLEKYETIIGLEVHVQLSTKSKAYCGDLNSFGEPANTCVSPISLGHPGTLPKPNKKVIEYAIKLGLAFNCKINFEILHFILALTKGSNASRLMDLPNFGLSSKLGSLEMQAR